MRSYVLISCERGKEQEVFNKLDKNSEVIESNMIFGEWDIILKVELASNEALGTFVLDKVRSLPGVTLASTLIVAR